MQNYILSLDQGTTSSKSILVNNKGEVVASYAIQVKQIYQQPGWVEHDPMEILNSQLESAKCLLQKNNISIEQIASIAITNQRETTILWNKTTGDPVYNAIVWQDRRTSERVKQLKDSNYEHMFRNKTGLVLDAYFSGTKIQWILENVKIAKDLLKENNLLFGTVDTWLTWNLTGKKYHVTDKSNASRTMLFNIHTCSWDDELLSIFNIPKQILPKIVTSSEIIGETCTSIFNKSIVISSIIGDQQAATFGNLCLNPGMVKNTYGTGCFLIMNTGNNILKSSHDLLTSNLWDLNNKPQYCLEGSVFNCGSIIEWLRDGLQIINTSSDVDQLATSISNNAGVYLIPAFTGLGAPYWDQYARGTILGITRGTNRAHIVRAALESIAFQVSDVLNSIRKDSGQNITMLRVDGGVSKSDFLMQFQADILDTPIERSMCLELTALGAAFLSGLAIGFWKNTDELKNVWKVDKCFIPSMSSIQRQDLIDSWHEGITRSLEWAKNDAKL